MAADQDLSDRFSRPSGSSVSATTGSLTHAPRRALLPPSHPMTVLIVGAGPTSLMLAAQLRSFGTRFRIIDRQADRVQ